VSERQASEQGEALRGQDEQRGEAEPKKEYGRKAIPFFIFFFRSEAEKKFFF
jgi:hypothetical protein